MLEITRTWNRQGLAASVGYSKYFRMRGGFCGFDEFGTHLIIANPGNQTGRKQGDSRKGIVQPKCSALSVFVSKVGNQSLPDAARS